jgi:hypothetical protein
MSKFERKIVACLNEKPMTMRQLQECVQTEHWNNIHWHLKSKPNSLVARGCVKEEPIQGYTTNRPQNTYRYVLLDECKV